ncbi:hypothetical protein [Auritidibacter ignavus]|uniref:hypothetical protein n=1 Tax=Auritidibacter ignavus TaxID=678932 RepID=UPI0015D574DD|nr:hypothetical protein [Auritidibacter ignavus]
MHAEITIEQIRIVDLIVRVLSAYGQWFSCDRHKTPGVRSGGSHEIQPRTIYPFLWYCVVRPGNQPQDMTGRGHMLAALGELSVIEVRQATLLEPQLVVP